MSEAHANFELCNCSTNMFQNFFSHVFPFRLNLTSLCFIWGIFDYYLFLTSQGKASAIIVILDGRGLREIHDFFQEKLRAKCLSAVAFRCMKLTPLAVLKLFLHSHNVFVRK